MKKSTILTCLFVFAAITFSAPQLNAGNKDVVEVDNIEDLRTQEADNSTVYQITGEVIITHQHGQRNQKYIQDATAAIVIDDNSGVITTEYNLYDGITGLKGKLSLYSGLLQFIPTEDPGDATSADNVVEPLVVTLDELNTAHQSMLIKVEEVEFDTDIETFKPSTNYTIADPTGTVVMRTPSLSAQLDYFGTYIPGGVNDMVFLVSQFNDNMQVFPRSLEDIYLDGVPEYKLTFSVIDEGDNAITDAIVTFNGEAQSAGVYVFEDVVTGVYAYSVEKAGYHTRTGEVVVSGGDIVKDIVLVAVSSDVVDGFPWEEDFETAVPPATWSHYALGGGEWEETTNANGGEAAVYHTFVADEEANSWLVTPQISIPEEGILLLKFFERNSLMSDYEYSGVKISNGSGNPIHNEFIEVYESESSINNYTEKSIDLSEFAGEIIYIAFVYQGQDAHQWYIDDVSIEEAPQDIEVADIATLREKEVGNLVYYLTGEVIITHMHGQRNQKYIQDNTAAIVIDDPNGVITTEYNLYDGITGIKGTLSAYSNLLQFTPVENSGAATSTGNVVDPLVITLSELAPGHQAMLVLIEDLEFDTDETTFTSSKSYNIFDPSGTGILRTPSSTAGLDYFGTDIPTAPVHLTALVSQFNNDMQIFPRSLADFEEASTSAEVNMQNLVRVYPNPFEDQIRIEGNVNIKQIIIYNVLGQAVMSVENPSIDIINTSKLSKGMYLVHIQSEDGGVSVAKVVKR